ncbi:dihydroorotase family protein [Candidatus Micrarchaeota archaeon]|nr:dihydroorotase family protein [Candidatus Micrarchaeota archaeon]
MLIKNGTLVTSKGLQKADIYIELGKIREIKKTISNKGAEKTIDATGLHVLPGMIDSHVHLRDFKEVLKEDFFSGTSAALAGGVTSVIDMPNNSLPTISMEALAAKKYVASKKALCNYGFNFGATLNNFEEASKALVDTSVASLKIYMGSSTGSLLVDDFSAFYKHLQNFKGKPILLHAEDEHAIRHFSKQHLGENQKSNGIDSQNSLSDARKSQNMDIDLQADSSKKPISAQVHGKIRNSHVAELAVSRAISSAQKTNAKIHICHVSTQKELELIHAARKKIKITCEVSPHHLFLDESYAKKLGNYAKVNPPLRSKSEIAYLWQALRSGKIDMIATDHAPHLREEKELPYLQAPSGMPELDTALLLFLDAVSKKQLSLPQLANLYSKAPAKLFGLKNKGEIAVGKDADLVLVNLKSKTKIKSENLFTKCHWSAYEGITANGKIMKTILGGKIAFDEGSVLARIGDGTELKFRA